MGKHLVPTLRKTWQRDKVSLLVRTTLGTQILYKFKLVKYLVPNLRKTLQRDKVSLLVRTIRGTRIL